MKLPTLSVVVPNYNHGHLLGRCLTAIQNQTVKPKEIIVIDDASTDDSFHLLRRIEPFFTVVRHRKNQGVVATINEGLALATGDCFYAPAADDEILPGFFERVLTLMAMRPEVAVGCSWGLWYNEDTGVEWVAGRTGRHYFAPWLAGTHFIPTHAAILRRNAIQPLREELGQFSDWWQVYSAACRHGLCVVPEALARFNTSRKTYYGRNRHRIPEVARTALKWLDLPENATICDLMPVHLLGPEAFWVLLENGRVNPRYLWHCAQVLANRHVPAWAIRQYVKHGGKTL
jgi:glycosyltransferase involved in cell wall biosynthesis